MQVRNQYNEISNHITIRKLLNKLNYFLTSLLSIAKEKCEEKDFLLPLFIELSI